MALNSMREPITLTGRVYQREGNIFPYSDYTIGINMSQKLYEEYYAYKFEDMKYFPRETAKELCKLLNIPYDECMLKVDASYTSRNTTQIDEPHKSKKSEVIKGFDSDFDVVRLKIFYDPILKYYGYPSFDFDECPMTDDEIKWILKFPFRFEIDYMKNNKDENFTSDLLRKNL